MSEINIRDMQQTDLQAIKTIYNHHIQNTHVNFETTPYDDEYMQNWFLQFDNSARHQAYVAIENDQILGFALSQKFRSKASYDTSVETTIYLNPSAIGKGLGKRLGLHLLEKLKSQDVNRAYAVVALPNKPSIGLHQALNYQQMAFFSEVGRKFNQFYDVVFLEYKF